MTKWRTLLIQTTLLAEVIYMIAFQEAFKRWKQVDKAKTYAKQVVQKTFYPYIGA